jgi:hypothetical protein
MDLASPAITNYMAIGTPYTNNSQISFQSGAQVTTLTPTTDSGGTIASYSISPSLPAGLHFNTSSGIISGTPSVEISETSFTVAGSNMCGTTSHILRITVTSQPLPSDANDPDELNIKIVVGVVLVTVSASLSAIFFYRRFINSRTAPIASVVPFDETLWHRSVAKSTGKVYWIQMQTGEISYTNPNPNNAVEAAVHHEKERGNFLQSDLQPDMLAESKK